MLAELMQHRMDGDQSIVVMGRMCTVSTADQVDSLIFDLDGTIYLGETALPGAQRVVDALRAAGRRTIFRSNNPTKTQQGYAKKLGGLGIPTETRAVYSSPAATVRSLATKMP